MEKNCKGCEEYCRTEHHSERRVTAVNGLALTLAAGYISAVQRYPISASKTQWQLQGQASLHYDTGGDPSAELSEVWLIMSRFSLQDKFTGPTAGGNVRHTEDQWLSTAEVQTDTRFCCLIHWKTSLFPQQQQKLLVHSRPKLIAPDTTWHIDCKHVQQGSSHQRLAPWHWLSWSMAADVGEAARAAK